MMTTNSHGGRKGIALVELALVVPLLLILLAGILNYALLLRTGSCVAVAARSGAQYGSRSVASSADAAGIRTAAVSAAPDAAGITVSSSQSCRCGDGSAVSCSGSCGSGAVRVYVQVTASASRAAIFSYSGLGFSGNTSSTATMRVQ
jgi:Flp pilus assembly protein TadG